MRHYYGPSTVSTPKAALTESDLHEICSLLDVSIYAQARDRCAFTFAFLGLLRINEYAGGGLRWRHVRVTNDGVDITVHSSKTAQHPVTISIAARPDMLCPVTAYRSLGEAGRNHHVPQSADAPLFLTLLDATAQRVEPTSADEFVRNLRFWLAAVNPEADLAQYAGHSFRRGGATAMLLAGVPTSVIQRHGRWRSDTWRQYIDSLNSPAVRLLATRSLARQHGARPASP